LGDDVWHECRFTRVPERILVVGLPDELEAHKDAKQGTEVSLSTLTYSNARVEVDNYRAAGQSVPFFSGLIPRGSLSLQGRSSWHEAYTETQGQWLNLDAYNAWHSLRNAFATEERERKAQYDADRSEYERRRNLCGAPPPPPPPPPPPEVCVPPGAGPNECPS
jgi:hypothetical protein